MILPVLNTRSVTAAAPEPAAIPVTEPRRIPVADDNCDAAETLTMQLQLAGHEVRTVHDGAETLVAAETFKPDIVLLDLGMPRMDGYTAARQIRARPWGAQVILAALTGWGQQQDRDRTADAGFDIHLVKPVDQAALFEAIAAASRGRSPVSPPSPHRFVPRGTGPRPPGMPDAQ